MNFKTKCMSQSNIFEMNIKLKALPMHVHDNLEKLLRL